MAFEFTWIKFIDAQIAHDAMADFMRSPLTGDIMEVPGIDINIKCKLALAPEPIYTTLQLIGKVLMLKQFDMLMQQSITCNQHVAIVAQWFQFKGIDNGETIALTLIEKINTFMPGLYDADCFN